MATDRSSGRTSGRPPRRGALRRVGGAVGRALHLPFTSTARGIRRATHAQGAGESGLGKLIELHAVNSAGDMLVTVALASTVFFAVPTDQARGRVALYLAITMAPFALLAPVVGPLLDRIPHGRRAAMAGAMLSRALLALMMSGAVATGGLELYPAALGVLVASKAYGVVRSAVVPRLLPPRFSLVKANSRVTLAGLLATGAAAPLGAGLQALGPSWPLYGASAVFVAGTVLSFTLPHKVDSAKGEAKARLLAAEHLLGASGHDRPARPERPERPEWPVRPVLGAGGVVRARWRRGTATGVAAHGPGTGGPRARTVRLVGAARFTRAVRGMRGGGSVAGAGGPGGNAGNGGNGRPGGNGGNGMRGGNGRVGAGGAAGGAKARRPGLRTVGPSVLHGLQANAALRALSGFLIFFLAFLLREHPLGGRSAAVSLGVVAVAAGAGNALGTAIGAWLKARNPEAIIASVLGIALGAAVVAAALYGAVLIAVIGAVAGLAQALGKLSLDALIQRDVPEEVRTSAFARSETLLQMSWVVGGAIGIALPLHGVLGMAVAAGLVALGAATTVRGLLSAARRGTPHPRVA
ncbi:MFS transporter [Streptomyces sp. URMC 123]|uniref:MFS transporter n=1 Tax=Streptomyces sp. URMC 123 TaxID=3423403 RepID=UPI003F194DDE